MVACGVVASMVDWGGELPGAGSARDGHACLPRALAVRVIHHDPAVSSDGGLLALRARRRKVSVETLAQQARTPNLSGILGHVFLELRPFCKAHDVVVDIWVSMPTTTAADV